MNSPYKMDLPYGRERGSYYHGLLSRPECWQCPLQTDTKVMPDGPVPARIAFVGEEPGCLLPNQYVSVGNSMPFLINTIGELPSGVTAASQGFYTGKVYRISAMGHSCDLTKDHKIKISHTGGSAFEWVAAQDVKPGMRVVIPKRNKPVSTRDDPFHKSIQLELMRGAYRIDAAIVAGAFMACGCCFEDTHIVRWAFPPKAPMSVYTVVYKWLKELGIDVLTKDITGSKLISVLDADLAETISSLYYRGHSKIPPDFLFDANPLQQSAFLFAWSCCLSSTLEGDSWVITTMSKEAFARTTDLCFRIGIMPYATVKPASSLTYTEVHQLTFSARDVGRLGWSAQTPHDDDDTALYTEDESSFRVAIEQCRVFIYSGPVYDLTTQNEEYNAPFVVHNSSELLRGKGFVGPSGQLLWYIAKACGIPREDVWVTNSALCQARPVTLANGAIIPKMYVKAKAAMCCRTRLLRELITVDPVVIVPLGNWALWSLTDIPKAKIYAYRGSRIDIDLKTILSAVESGASRAPMREIRAAT